MQQKTYTVNVLQIEDEFIHLEYDIFRTKIKKCLIEDNELKIVNNKVALDKVFIEHWFAESIKAEEERIKNCFLTNIPLFWKKREMILKEPQYYSVTPPIFPFGGGIPGVYISVSTLGVLLQIWENEEVFTVRCKICGGKALVFQFAGSFYSGALFAAKNICIQCGCLGNDIKTYRFSDYRKNIRKYKPLQPVAKKRVSIDELVRICKTAIPN